MTKFFIKSGKSTYPILFELSEIFPLLVFKGSLTLIFFKIVIFDLVFLGVLDGGVGRGRLYDYERLLCIFV